MAQRKRRDLVCLPQAGSDGGAVCPPASLPSFLLLRTPPGACCWQGGSENKNPGAFSDLLLLWLYFVFFLPSNALLVYPFTPQDWVDLTALPGRAEQFLLIYFCVRHKYLCLKFVLELVHGAETRSVLKGHCTCIFLQEVSFTGVVINRSCFFCPLVCRVNVRSLVWGG